MTERDIADLAVRSGWIFFLLLGVVCSQLLLEISRLSLIIAKLEKRLREYAKKDADANCENLSDGKCTSGEYPYLELVQEDPSTGERSQDPSTDSLSIQPGDQSL